MSEQTNSDTETPTKQPPRQLMGISPRIETGPLRFGDDWPGLFIRGDNAFGLAMTIDQVLEYVRVLTQERELDFDQDTAFQLALRELIGLRDTIRQDVIVSWPSDN